MIKITTEVKKQTKVKISPVVLGQNKSRYAALEASLAKSGMDKDTITARIKQRMEEDALVLGVTIEKYEKLLKTVKGKRQVANIQEHKEQFRTEFDRLTENVLFAINNTEDNRLAVALSALLDYDSKFQEITQIKQTDRNDFRGLIVLSASLQDTTKLAIYRGGWGDGSKQDRNQYSNGRRVPVAKSSGYALAQKLPVWTGEEVPVTV